MARHNDERSDGAAKFYVIKPYFKKLAAAHPEFKRFDHEWRFRDEDSSVPLPARAFSLEALKTLLEIYRSAGSKMSERQSMGLIAAQIRIVENPNSSNIGTLQALETAIISFIRKDILRCWVFVQREGSNILEAALVEDVAYFPPVKHKDYVEPAFVSMRCAFWGKNESRGKSFIWHREDLSTNKGAEALLLEKGILHENSTLIKEYDVGEERFLKWRKMLGEQFVGNGSFTHAESSWRERDEDMHGARLVVDDRCTSIEVRRATQLFNFIEESSSSDETPIEGDPALEYSRLPLQFYIYCFNLDSYRGGWVHQDDMVPYVYRPELREKLILPPQHEDLIDALTADMDVLMEDIVTGKSGGTCVLLQGKAGTGKTLTAEVYSEVIKRPLYRIHSGQLGTDSESVEKELNTALDNAKRWRALLLIDEADVFVCERGADLEMNAVISVFLRTLEYYDGVLFLTTNRIDTIDEAILSRCIAQIKYDVPSFAERVELWKTLGGVYGLKMVEGEKMAHRLAKRFECTGRDIKGLIRLITKYCRQRKTKPTFEDFERMAVFKGL